MTRNNLIFFESEEEYTDFLKKDVIPKEEWSDPECPELCVLKYKDPEYRVYEGRGKGSIAVVYKEVIYQGKDSIVTPEFIVLSPSFGKEVAYFPYERKRVRVRGVFEMYGKIDIRLKDSMMDVTLSIEEYEELCLKFKGSRQVGVEWGKDMNDGEGPGYYMTVLDEDDDVLFICFHPDKKRIYFT